MLHAIAPIESDLFIFHSHSSVKLFWVRYDIVASVEFANFQAVVAKLGEAVPVVCLILQQEDWELARGGAALWVRVFDGEPPNHLPFHY